MKPTIGRIVLVNINHDGPAVMRPALITEVWDEYTVNLRVFFDGGNDEIHRERLGLGADNPDWLTSVSLALTGDGSVGYRHWCWPPRV